MLDTNVWLDLLWFEDPRAAALKAALDAGELVAVCNEECRDEWLRVLRYPALRLDDDRRESLTRAFDVLVRPWPATGNVENDRESAPLPRCRDPDDQKFLQLAHDAGASWLLSRDRHLLSLAARCRRDGRFRIMTPDAWATDRG